MARYGTGQALLEKTAASESCVAASSGVEAAHRRLEREERRAGAARILTPREPGRDPNRQVFWFRVELHPAGSQVWFRITSEASAGCGREDTVSRGERLVDALLAWLTPARRLEPRSTASRFRSPIDGDTSFERTASD